MEKEFVNTGLLKVRCPQCFKLFNVNTQQIADKRPKYECNQCQERFSIQLPDCLGMEEVIGFSESWEVSVKKEIPKQDNVLSQERLKDVPKVEPLPQEDCPKCGEQNPVSALECEHCNIVIQKYRENLKDPISSKAPQKLKELWLMVLKHYEDEDLHQEFVRQCRKTKQLEYASSRYRKILDGQPNEELAQKFINEIIAISSLPLDRPIKKETKKFKVPFLSLAMLLSSLVMFVGYIAPEFRNLMGIGAAFLFITTAIRLVFK